MRDTAALGDLSPVMAPKNHRTEAQHREFYTDNSRRKVRRVRVSVFGHAVMASVPHQSHIASEKRIASASDSAAIKKSVVSPVTTKG